LAQQNGELGFGHTQRGSGVYKRQVQMALLAAPAFMMRSFSPVDYECCRCVDDLGARQLAAVLAAVKDVCTPLARWPEEGHP
jgi:hypothetical protein